MRKNDVALPRTPGDLRDAPLEDEVLHDDDSGKDSDDDNIQGVTPITG
jgi:hypothetical protein